GHPVELQSNPGRGSRFSVSVPLAAELRGTVQLPVTLRATDLVRGKRVMVIDDDVLVLDGMRGILQSWGCRVQTAASGAAALVSVADGGAPPDLIISDLRLADGETGIEVIERYARRWARLFQLSSSAATRRPSGYARRVPADTISCKSRSRR